MKRFILYTLLYIIALTATAANLGERIIILNEGNWQSDNARLSYFDNGTLVSNQWFRDKNGQKIGDTPNDIIQINDNLIAIAVNWSNIIQFISTDGKAVAATEDVPNNRKLATDGDFVYVTSYAHECYTTQGYKYFTKGFVAKIDAHTFSVVDAVEVGYEPEGIAYYDGYLFVANSGGYAFQEGHDYESTVSIIEAKTMTVFKTIDTGCINLYGQMSKSGKYLLINSCGDYYDVPAASLVFDCDKALKGQSCVKTLSIPVTYNTVTTDGKFLAIGSAYSYYEGGYTLSFATIDPAAVFSTGGGISYTLPGTLKSDIESFTAPYGIYVNPYTGYIYATDAAENASAGKLYQWSPEGKMIGNWKVYINPGHFLALPPDGHFTGIENTAVVTRTEENGKTYDISGREVSTPQRGTIVIRNGKKFVKR